MKTLNEIYHSLLGRGADGPAICAVPARADDHGAVAARHLHQIVGPTHERANIQFHVQPLSLDRFGEPLHRFPAITVSRLQPAPHLARRRCGCARPIPPRRRDRAQLSLHRGGPPRRRRRHPRHPPADGASRRWPIPAARIPARAGSRRRRRATLIKAAGDIGTTIFHPVGTAKMGLRQRSAPPWWTSACACMGLERLARDRRLGDADDHLGQHQHPHHHDRRQGQRHGFGRRKAGIVPLMLLA